MSKLSIIVVTILATVQFAVTVWTLQEVVSLHKDKPEVVSELPLSRQDIEDHYEAFTTGTHFCQLVCYGRMKSYSFNRRESRCVCFNGFISDD